MWFQTNIQDDARVKPIRVSLLSATRVYPTFIPRWWSPPITRKGGLSSSQILFLLLFYFLHVCRDPSSQLFRFEGGSLRPRLFVCSPCLVVLLASLIHFSFLWTVLPSYSCLSLPLPSRFVYLVNIADRKFTWLTGHGANGDQDFKIKQFTVYCLRLPKTGFIRNESDHFPGWPNWYTG